MVQPACPKVADNRVHAGNRVVHSMLNVTASWHAATAFLTACATKSTGGINGKRCKLAQVGYSLSQHLPGRRPGTPHLTFHADKVLIFDYFEIKF